MDFSEESEETGHFSFNYKAEEAVVEKAAISLHH